MSEFATNRGCDQCKKIEVSLVEIKIGGKQIFLCYSCMLKFCKDLDSFRLQNFTPEENSAHF
jgi:hypothetical protein